MNRRFTPGRIRQGLGYLPDAEGVASLEKRMRGCGLYKRTLTANRPAKSLKARRKARS